METGSNAIIFGEAGVGKSSVINMLFDNYTAEISDSVIGCTFHPKLCRGQCKGYPLNLYDTAGLDECDSGSVKADAAVENLTQFVKNLQEDIDLLIMCVKNGRISRTILHNYQLLYDQLFDRHVPILLVVTHCELENPIDAWKVNNESVLKTRFKMEFSDVICVTTVNEGKYGARFREKYELSRATLCHSIARHLLKKILVREGITGSITIKMKRIWNILACYFGFPKIALHRKLYSIFQEFGFDHDEAVEKTNILFDE